MPLEKRKIFFCSEEYRNSLRLEYVDFLIVKLSPTKIFLLHSHIDFIENYVQNKYQNIDIHRVTCPRRGWNNSQNGGQQLLALL